MAHSGLIRHYGPVVSDQLLIHSQLDAFSAACRSLHTPLFLSPALIPSLPSILHTYSAGNPLHSISTGNSQVLQPRLLHCSCSSVYLAILCFITSCLPGDRQLHHHQFPVIWRGDHIIIINIIFKKGIF